MTPLDFKPAPHQIDNARFLTEWDRAALFDEPGAGKTSSVMLALQQVFGPNSPGNVLIVCPTSVTLMWRDYIRRWFPGTLVRLTPTTPDTCHHTGVTVASYDIVAMGRLAFQEHPWSVVILDEAQAAKTWGLTRAEVLFGDRGIVPSAMYAWFLTGTPITRYADDLYPMFRALRPDHPAARSIGRFRRTYCVEELRRFGSMPARKVVTGNNEVALGDLWEALQGTYRRTALADAVKGLPPLRVDVLPLEVDANARRQITVALQDVPELVPLLRRWEAAPDDDNVLAAFAQALEGMSEGHTSKLRRVLGQAKAPLALGYIAEEAQAQKIVVFVQHINAMLVPLAEGLEEALGDDTVEVIHGETSAANRSRIETRFNEDPTCRVVVIQTRAGGVGLNLQNACSRVVEVEADWSPHANQQAWARVHRWGQEHPVHVTRLVLAETIDAAVLAVGERKLAGAAQVITEHT